MKPFFKSAGGKTKMLPALMAGLPKRIDLYVEPFVGGGALFFALAEEKRFEKAIIADTNRDLIGLYRAVRNCTTTEKDFIPALKDMERTYLQKTEAKRQEYYYVLRDKMPSQPLRTLFLNRTCFNGLWRVNNAGKFNVPWGKYDNPTICDEETLLAASEALKDVAIVCSSFDSLLIPKTKGRLVVYCDPPYDDVSVKKTAVKATKSFTKYGKNDFTWADQCRLAVWPWWTMMTNADTKRIRKIYAGNVIEVVPMKRSINSVAAKRGNVNELIIRRRA